MYTTRVYVKKKKKVYVTHFPAGAGTVDRGRVPL